MVPAPPGSTACSNADSLCCLHQRRFVEFGEHASPFEARPVPLPTPQHLSQLPAKCIQVLVGRDILSITAMVGHHSLQQLTAPWVTCCLMANAISSRAEHWCYGHLPVILIHDWRPHYQPGTGEKTARAVVLRRRRGISATLPLSLGACSRDGTRPAETVDVIFPDATNLDVESAERRANSPAVRASNGVHEAVN